MFSCYQGNSLFIKSIFFWTVVIKYSAPVCVCVCVGGGDGGGIWYLCEW